MSSTGFDTAGNVVSGLGAGINLAVNPGAENALINNGFIKSLKAGIATKNGQALGGTYLEGNYELSRAFGFRLRSHRPLRGGNTFSAPRL